METKKRTLVRSAIWIGLGACISITLTYIWFGNTFLALTLNGTIIAVNFAVKYVYERMFNRIKWGTK